jgi:tetratricopeptide (TPR) repeat protein
MIRGAAGCFHFRRRLAMNDMPSSIAASSTSLQPLYYCSSSKTSLLLTSMITMPGRDNNITKCINDNLQRQRQQRLFSTDNNNNDDDDDGDNKSSSYTQLLTQATAKQLQGDIPSAIKLTIQGLELMKTIGKNETNQQEIDENEIAETMLFLGKLYQLENQFENAVKSFEKARDRFGSGGGEEDQQQQLDNNNDNDDDSESSSIQTNTNINNIKKRYYTSITHLAYAQKELGQYEESEKNYLKSLSGLEQLVGYTDGMTNHTCYELSQLYKTQNKFRKAIEVLEDMKLNLSIVFGKTDSKVLQLNSELANLLILSEKEGEPSSVVTVTTNKAVPSSLSSSSSSSSSSSKNAIDLLEEAMDNLPPNSPEGRRIFMQIEELKEQQQQQQQHQDEDQQQQPEQQQQHPGYW